jgi:hypothetical protein
MSQYILDTDHVSLFLKRNEPIRNRLAQSSFEVATTIVTAQELFNGWVTLINEIKTDSSAKMCVRNAIGQLIEYSMYPTQEKAHQLIVVGDAPLSIDDASYLSYLRSRFSLPIYYAQFSWEQGGISSP